MRFSPFVERIAGHGVVAWDIHHEAFEAQRQGSDVLILSVGDPDFATPDFITEAAVGALQAGDTHYTDIAGRPDLRQAIAGRYSKRLGREVTASGVITLAGAQNALFAASLCLLQAGDEVLVLDPMYVTYEATLKASGATLVRVACDADTGFRPDLQRLEAAISPHTRAIFLSNPNNPTGVVLDAEELQGIARLAIAHDLWVVVDEVYESLCYERTHQPGQPAGHGRSLCDRLQSVQVPCHDRLADWLAGGDTGVGHPYREPVAEHALWPARICHGGRPGGGSGA